MKPIYLKNYLSSKCASFTFFLLPKLKKKHSEDVPKLGECFLSTYKALDLFPSKNWVGWYMPVRSSLAV